MKYVRVGKIGKIKVKEFQNVQTGQRHSNKVTNNSLTVTWYANNHGKTLNTKKERK